MTIAIKLFGFGEDRPAAFQGKNQLVLELETPTTPRLLLQAVGIEDSTGLVLMSTDQVIPLDRWDEPSVNNEDQLTLLSTFEGG